jgi:Holliday junction resolvase RusA-like endonuclease
MNEICTFVITGAPRTKKNSSVMDFRSGRTRKLPSKPFQEWNKSAQMQLAIVRAGRRRFPITIPVNVRAFIFREQASGDASNYYQAIADALQEGRIVTNDSLIVSWDGSRLLKDAVNPRVEISIMEAS